MVSICICPFVNERPGELAARSRLMVRTINNSKID